MFVIIFGVGFLATSIWIVVERRNDLIFDGLIGAVGVEVTSGFVRLALMSISVLPERACQLIALCGIGVHWIAGKQPVRTKTAIDRWCVIKRLNNLPGDYGVVLIFCVGQYDD